jgi:hypothetical protein
MYEGNRYKIWDGEVPRAEETINNCLFLVLEFANDFERNTV